MASVCFNICENYKKIDRPAVFQHVFDSIVPK